MNKYEIRKRIFWHILANAALYFIIAFCNWNISWFEGIPTYDGVTKFILFAGIALVNVITEVILASI